MTSIDWDRFDAQRLLASDEPEACTVDDVRRYLGTPDDVFYERLRQALDELPPLSRSLAFRLWLAEMVWRFREALHAVRFYP